jgi:light-regulated signal transduction histidine kinase (bacteriophytochrome)
MYELGLFTVTPLAALLGSAIYTLVAAYRLGDWRPVIFVVVLLVMGVHQANELAVFLGAGADQALSGFGEYPETTANLLTSLATVLLLRFVERERDLSHRLEERVQERTADLESFTYSVSHDLRTPLRAIDGYTRILNEEHADQLDADGRRLLNEVHAHTQKMGALIDDLLTLSRLGRREIERVEVDVAALARDTFEEVRRAHARAADAVSFEVQALPPARADRSMLRHVLTNLLSNALKFTRDEARPRITVGTTNQTGAPAYFVRDNGVGFDMAYVDKLFGVFERLHNDDEFDGTGVGLAVVERIVHRHGGEVWAEGAEGEGTTIYFTLPDADEADHE